MLPPPPATFDGSIDGLVKLIKTDLESVADSRRRMVELLRGEDDMVKFIKVADKVFKGKTHIPGKGDTPSLDLVCERAGVNRSVVFGACARVLHRYHFDVAQIQIGAVIEMCIRDRTWTACSTTCEIDIPGLSQHEMYYIVDRKNAAGLITSSLMQVVGVP